MAGYKMSIILTIDYSLIPWKEKELKFDKSFIRKYRKGQKYLYNRLYELAVHKLLTLLFFLC